MPLTPEKQAHDYAVRIRARLPRRLQEEREAVGLRRDALERKCGITRAMLGRIEKGKSNPSLCLVAQVSHGLGMTLAEFVCTDY